jgi:hypothetical protein
MSDQSEEALEFDFESAARKRSREYVAVCRRGAMVGDDYLPEEIPPVTIPKDLSKVPGSRRASANVDWTGEATALVGRTASLRGTDRRFSD